ncbi:hypothetical protein [Sporosarcina psychrophila]|uniref:hypothetical protein n=1 Tax=Sporosarcina psychrophila TaxID=1476 RepID=UPI00078CFC4A|nr:hypothetical protein [Sporosarcina psychrophila]AMQ06764.1 hypothetical protein AZE41_12925 [Sporosarcina psychrophila]
METCDLGLKSNWSEFKEFVQSHNEKRYSTIYYFVVEDDDHGDEAKFFTDHDELDKWLAQSFFDWERYDTRNLEDSMEDIRVWMLIPESEVTRLKSLYEGSRKTSIVKDGELYFRKLMPVSVEQTVIVSTNWY